MKRYIALTMILSAMVFMVPSVVIAADVKAEPAVNKPICPIQKMLQNTGAKQEPPRIVKGQRCKKEDGIVRCWY